MKLISCVVAAGLCATVHAEPARYLEVGAVFGAFGPSSGAEVPAEIAIGFRRTEHRWLRVAIVAGPTFGDEYHGAIVQARVGYEWHACAGSGFACVGGGIDVAGFYSTRTDTSLTPETTSRWIGAIAIPRGALELGDEQFRLRLGLEGGLGVSARIAGTDSGGGAATLALTLGLAFLW